MDISYKAHLLIYNWPLRTLLPNVWQKTTKTENKYSAKTKNNQILQESGVAVLKNISCKKNYVQF